MTHRPSPPIGRIVVGVLGGVVVLLGLALIWFPPLLPCADAPNHLLSVQVHRTPERFAGLLVPNVPATALGFVGPMLLLPSGLDLFTSARVVHTMWLVVAVVGAVRLARQAGTSAPLACAGAVYVALGWAWVMGFWNYTGAIALGLLGASFHTERAGRSMWIAGILHALAGLAHLPGGLVFGAWGAWLRWMGGDRPGRLRGAALPLLPLVGVAAWTMWTSSGQEANLGTIRLGGWQWTPFLQRPWEFFTLAADNFSEVGPFAAALALGAAAAAWRSLPPAGLARAGLVGAAIGLCVFVVLPLSVPGWSYLSPRILPPVALAGWFFFVPSARWSRWVEGALLALAALALALSVAQATDEGRQGHALTHPLAASPPGRTYSAMFGVRAEVGAPPYAVTRGGLAGYAMLAGGAGPGIFAHDPAKDAMVFSGPVESLFPEARAWWQVGRTCALEPRCMPPERAADQIAREALSWDSLYLGDPVPGVADRLLVRGYVPASAHTWQPRPARFEVAIPDPGPERAPGALVVQWIWPDTLGPVWTRTVPADARTDGAVWRAEALLPAGPGLLLAWIDADGDGRRGPDEMGWDVMQGALGAGDTNPLELPGL